jgi:signal transduction histidine kinase
LGLSTCKKIAEALSGDIFLVDDDDPEMQPHLIDCTPRFKHKKTVGTAIALVLKYPEINEKFKD